MDNVPNHHKIIRFKNPVRRNLCFSNAVMTVIMNIPHFQESFRLREESFSQNNLIYKEIMTVMNLPNGETFSTVKLRSAVMSQCMNSGQNFLRYNDNNQHDAAEFMRSVIEHLFKTDIRSENLLEYLFGGLSQRTMSCPCNHVDELPYASTPEIIPIALTGNSLETCIESYFSPEVIERRCPSCNEERSTQTTTFVTSPANLILQLKRFEFDRNLNRSVKKHDTIQIPERLELPGGEKYCLLSIINHIGETPNSGHYNCLLSENNENLYTLVDDENVTESVRLTENMSKTAYILSYAKLQQL